jgi:hypothetical protein
LHKVRYREPTMTTEQLAALKEVATLAAEKIPHPKGCDCMAQFNRRFTPATCLELVEEVERLRDRWNTRFNTLCGNCGKRYLGPRDEHLHGLGICGGTK